jgi:fructokinase
MTPHPRLGIDFGGTKIAGIALAADGSTVAAHRSDTPRHDYDASIAAVADMVAELERQAGAPGSVGIGIPGAVSPATGLVKNANSDWLIGRPFDADVAVRLGRPVRVANDADCFALSEATDGAGAGAAIVFGVILGTGTGGGIVVNGRLLPGADAIAGEWGHNPLPAPREEERPGPPCYCGRRGCIETWLSGPGLARDHRAVTGTELDGPGIVAAAAAGEPAARATLARHAERLGRALAHVVNIVDPQVIVLGGGLSGIAALYDELPALVRPHVFSDRLAARIVPPAHGPASGVRGAAWLWSADETTEALP